MKLLKVYDVLDTRHFPATYYRICIVVFEDGATAVIKEGDHPNRFVVTLVSWEFSMERRALRYVEHLINHLEQFSCIAMQREIANIERTES